MREHWKKIKSLTVDIKSFIMYVSFKSHKYKIININIYTYKPFVKF